MFIENQFQAINFNQKVMLGETFAMPTNPKFKVLWSVIVFWFTQVMNSFRWEKWSTKFSSHYKTMFENSTCSITILSLLHAFNSLTKKLIFWRKTSNSESNIATFTNTSCMRSPSSGLWSWWSTERTRTLPTKSRKCITMSDANSANPSILTAYTTRNHKSCRISIINNLPLIPVNEAARVKMQVWKRFCIWFSSHRIYPFINFSSRKGILAYNTLSDKECVFCL